MIPIYVETDTEMFPLCVESSDSDVQVFQRFIQMYPDQVQVTGIQHQLPRDLPVGSSSSAFLLYAAAGRWRAGDVAMGLIGQASLQSLQYGKIRRKSRMRNSRTKKSKTRKSRK
jgi:hypothetical protein